MLRAATENDLDIMLAWRNQPANREVSLQRHEITREEHLAWWERVRSDPSRIVLIAEVDNRPVGVVTFFDIDRDRSTASWGFYLDNTGLSGQGLMISAWMHVMREATDYAFDVLNIDTLAGEVLEHNMAVRAMNRRFRFAEGKPDVREIDGRRVTVVPIVLARSDRRRRRRQ